MLRHLLRSSRFRKAIPWILSGALAAQAAQPGVLACRASPAEATRPTVADLRASFPGRALHQVDPLLFQRIVAAHSGQGRLLTGPTLAAALAARPAGFPSGSSPAASIIPPIDSAARSPGLPAVDTAADSAREIARSRIPNSAARQDGFDRDSLVRTGMRDSLDLVTREGAGAAESEQDWVAGGNQPDAGDRNPVGPGYIAESDHTDYEDERAKGWFVNFFADASDSDAGVDGDELAAVLYVVIGVVVVGAFVLYGFKALYDVASNRNEDPLFLEAGLRISYSGKAMGGGVGSPELYRDAYLAGVRFAIGLDRPGMGVGVAVEGGYIDVHLRGVSDPARSFEFPGGYLVAGPMIRFGHNDPFSFNLEFLNGTSDHASIGWISKSRMSLQTKVAGHFLMGAHLGAVFYDLHFLDGLGWRSGSFNRDLSLVYGLETGWEF